MLDTWVLFPPSIYILESLLMGETKSKNTLFNLYIKPAKTPPLMPTIVHDVGTSGTFTPCTQLKGLLEEIWNAVWNLVKAASWFSYWYESTAVSVRGIALVMRQINRAFWMIISPKASIHNTISEASPVSGPQTTTTVIPQERCGSHSSRLFGEFQNHMLVMKMSPQKHVGTSLQQPLPLVVRRLWQPATSATPYKHRQTFQELLTLSGKNISDKANLHQKSIN